MHSNRRGFSSKWIRISWLF